MICLQALERTEGMHSRERNDIIAAVVCTLEGMASGGARSASCSIGIGNDVGKFAVRCDAIKDVM